MHKRLFFFFPALMLSAAPLLEIWHFPAEAVNDLDRARLEDLFETWNPRLLEDKTLPEEPGEYLEYRHETLMYFFGPFSDAESAAEGQATLDRIRRTLIQRDPAFQTSRVALHYRPGRITADTGESPAETPFPDPSNGEQTAWEQPDGAAPVQEADSRRNVPAFWIGTLLILAASGILLRKTA
jgi:hypothetical protein